MTSLTVLRLLMAKECNLENLVSVGAEFPVSLQKRVVLPEATEQEVNLRYLGQSFRMSDI